MKVPCWHFWRVRSCCVKVVCHSIVLAGHGMEKLIRALCNLFSLSFRLLALSSAIQWWAQCRQKHQLGRQILMIATTLCTPPMLWSVIRLQAIMTKPNTVMPLVHRFQGIAKPEWGHHEFLEACCCFLLTCLFVCWNWTLWMLCLRKNGLDHIPQSSSHSEMQ